MRRLVGVRAHHVEVEVHRSPAAVGPRMVEGSRGERQAAGGVRPSSSSPDQVTRPSAIGTSGSIRPHASSMKVSESVSCHVGRVLEMVHVRGPPVDPGAQRAASPARSVRMRCSSRRASRSACPRCTRGRFDLVERGLAPGPPSSPGMPSGTRMSRSCTQVSNTRIRMKPGVRPLAHRRDRRPVEHVVGHGPSSSTRSVDHLGEPAEEGVVVERGEIPGDPGHGRERVVPSRAPADQGGLDRRGVGDDVAHRPRRDTATACVHWSGPSRPTTSPKDPSAARTIGTVSVRVLIGRAFPWAESSRGGAPAGRAPGELLPWSVPGSLSSGTFTVNTSPVRRPGNRPGPGSGPVGRWSPWLGISRRSRSSRSSSTGSSSSAARRSSRSSWSSPTPCASRDPKMKALVDPLKAAGEGPGPVGPLPRQGARRARVRPAQAGPPQRDPRPLRLGPGHLRLPGPRHRQHGAPRRLRDRRAEGALARTRS